MFWIHYMFHQHRYLCYRSVQFEINLIHYNIHIYLDVYSLFLILLYCQLHVNHMYNLCYFYVVVVCRLCYVLSSIINTQNNGFDCYLLLKIDESTLISVCVYSSIFSSKFNAFFTVSPISIVT